MARLLAAEGCSLQGNAKQVEGSQHPDRDAQFRYISGQASSHMVAGQPVISVDAKKKENVGRFKNGGREWRPRGEPERVNVYDFIDKDLGKVTPYGVYDIAADAGWVQRGHRPRHRRVRGPDDPHLVAESRAARLPRREQAADLRRRRRLQRLPHPAVEGRAGGAGRRDRAGDHRVPLPARHAPGTSKWNKIEHRLFSQISMNWRGRPLESHEVIVSLIASTRTRTGLTVGAALDTGEYPKGVKISGKAMRDLETNSIQRHPFHGEWNYTLPPARPP